MARTLTGVAVIVVVGLVHTTWAATIAANSHTALNMQQSFYANYIVGQTFKATATGAVTDVSTLVHTYSPPGSNPTDIPITLSICNVHTVPFNGLQPTWPALCTGTIAYNDPTVTGMSVAWVKTSMTPPATLQAGTTYMLVATAQGTDNYYTWYFDSTYDYPDGNGVIGQSNVSGGMVAQQSCDLPFQVNGVVVTLSPAAGPLPDGTAGTACPAQTISATGGTGPYTYAVTGGALPDGLTIDASSGAITGTPTAAGTFSFTITGTDTITPFGASSQAYTMVIHQAFSPSGAVLAAGTLGTAYNQTISVTGGTAPVAYAVTVGALPDGLTLDPASGAIAGTPTAGGTFNFTVQATDSTAGPVGPAVDNQAYTIVVALPLSPASLPDGTVGVAYNQTVSVTGGTAPATYAVTAGTLPGGLTLDANTGKISGTPTVAGPFSFTITGTDSSVPAATGHQAYTVQIVQPIVLQPVVPTVTTTAISDDSITATGATGGGNVTSDGGAQVTARGVCWSTSANPTTAGSHTTDGAGTGSFTSDLTGLSAGTTYHVRAYATNTAGTGYGDDVQFATASGAAVPVLPTVTTSDVEISPGYATRATGGGNVTSDGGAAVTARGVCWSASVDPTVADSHTEDGEGTGSFTSSIHGLSPATTYSIRAYATNSVGTSYGESQQLKTPSTTILDVVATLAPTCAVLPVLGMLTLFGLVRQLGMVTVVSRHRRS